MNKILTLLFCAILFSSCTPPKTNKGTWEYMNLASRELQYSVFKTDTNFVGIYLPPSYHTNKKKRYPVIYFLEGYQGKVDKNGFYAELIDQLMYKREIPEFIFVDISGAYQFGGSFYVNSDVSGNWESYIINDVIGFVDKNYRTLERWRSRAITGVSTGGFGARNLAMKYPDVFGSCYMMNPAIFSKEGIYDTELFKDGGTSDEIFKLMNSLKDKNKEEAHKLYLEYVSTIKDWKVEWTLAFGMAFSPNIDKAPYFNYPCTKGKDGQLIFDKQIMNQWAKTHSNFNPIFDKYKKNLKKLRLLAIDCAYNNSYEWVFQGAHDFHESLVKEQIPHTMIWHNGGHLDKFVEQFTQKMVPITISSLCIRQ